MLNNNDYMNILNDIFGSSIFDVNIIKKQVLENFNSIDQKFIEYEAICYDAPEYLKSVQRCHEAIVSIYNKLSFDIIKQIIEDTYKMPINMALATHKQEEIKMLFKQTCAALPLEFQQKINIDLEEIANRLNNRFKFDDEALINLIEASKGTNIQLEEDIIRTSDNNKRVILRQGKEGDYHFTELSPIKKNENATAEEINRLKKQQLQKFTQGGKIPDLRSESNVLDLDKIMLRNYPGYASLDKIYSKDETMKILINNLFENLNLCYETYMRYYLDPKGKVVENEATLADGSNFNFKYIINSYNIPHLLGIPPAKYLPLAVRNKLKLDEYDNAAKVLASLLKNQNSIIAEGGLFKENEKLYQMLPWEKIILKTSSFMRGDFFKNCFCLVELEKGGYLADPKEKYFSITSTRYNENFIDNNVNINSILRDLYLTKKQSKDFIFRGFIQEENGFYIPNTIMTGKAESIHVGKNKEKLLTLQRYRNIISENCAAEGGKIVQRIINENGYIKTFTPQEQLLLHSDIYSQLGYSPQLSPEALDYALSIKDGIETILEEDLFTILNPDIEKKR